MNMKYTVINKGNYKQKYRIKCTLLLVKKINVLGLFDGISCGMMAFERAGIPVGRYAAYEIDKYAVQVSRNNYPQIEHCGDVFNGDFRKYKGFDILIGGSPCTYWSIAKKGRETTPDGAGGKLFMQYVRALKESGCRYFLYENNYSIHKNIKEFISEQLGTEPVMINSALVSAQQRKRCYWTNIPGVTQPEDRNIFVKDILESSQRTIIGEPVVLNDFNSKARTIKAQYSNTSLANTFRQDGFGATMIAESVRIGTVGKGGQGERIYSIYGKTVCMSANGGGRGAKTGLYEVDLPDGDYIIRKLTPVEAERCQTLPDNYTCFGIDDMGKKIKISNTQRYKCIGNGWTVDVIAHILSFMRKYIQGRIKRLH